MKRYVLTMLCLFSANLAFSQKIDSVLFNGATKSIIENSATDEENFKMSGKVILNLGYNIEKKDTDFFQLNTEPVKVNAQGASYLLSIFITSSKGKVVIVPKTKNLNPLVKLQSDVLTPYTDIQYKRLRPITRLIFDRITKIASAFPSSKITFSE